MTGALLASLTCLVIGVVQAQPQSLPDDKSPSPIELEPQVSLEPHALELLKASSQRLATAKAMSFTAVTTYESPARTGEPLAYTTISEVTLQRPDKLRVVTPADGPRSEFYYDGKTIMAYAPDTRLAAVAEAPPTIDAMLKTAYDTAAIYFPFTDVIVADPYKDMEESLKIAFVVGQSHVVGGTTTDIVAFADDNVQIQLWIGADDKLPRMMRATFFDEPGNYRHVAEFLNWQLDPQIAAGTFASADADKAQRMPFARPDTELATKP
jgi:hypothetical protein